MRRIIWGLTLLTNLLGPFNVIEKTPEKLLRSIFPEQLGFDPDNAIDLYTQGHECLQSLLISTRCYWDAMIELSMLLNIIICNQVFYQGMKKVSLQKTFQSSMSLLNALFGLNVRTPSD